MLTAFVDAELEFISSFWLGVHRYVSVVWAALFRFVAMTICDSLLSTLKDYFFRAC